MMHEKPHVQFLLSRMGRKWWQWSWRELRFLAGTMIWAPYFIAFAAVLFLDFGFRHVPQGDWPQMAIRFASAFCTGAALFWMAGRALKGLVFEHFVVDSMGATAMELLRTQEQLKAARERIRQLEEQLNGKRTD